MGLRAVVLVSLWPSSLLQSSSSNASSRCARRTCDWLMSSMSIFHSMIRAYVRCVRPLYSPCASSVTGAKPRLPIQSFQRSHACDSRRTSVASIGFAELCALIVQYARLCRRCRRRDGWACTRGSMPPLPVRSLALLDSSLLTSSCTL